VKGLVYSCIVVPRRALPSSCIRLFRHFCCSMYRFATMQCHRRTDRQVNIMVTISDHNSCSKILNMSLNRLTRVVKVKKVKAGSSSSEPHLRATGRHLPYGITVTQCYLPPDTSERAPPNPSHARWYSIYLPRRDGRLS